MRSLPLRLLSLAVMVACLSSLQASRAAADTGSVTPTPVAAPSLKVVSATLLAAINRDRLTHHVTVLLLDKKQSACSRKHSLHMAALGIISHDQFPSDICVTHGWAGENVGVANGDAIQSVLTMHKMMMDEGPCPHKRCTGNEFETHGHYLNLINPHFKHVGIGIVIQNDSVWLTENFTD